MPLHLPQRTQDQLFYDHDLRTDTLDYLYTFRSVLAHRHWNQCSLGVKMHWFYKGRQKRRFPLAHNSLNFS